MLVYELDVTGGHGLTFATLHIACWELCRLDNNIGFWVVWLPLAWSISMAYHSLPEISGRDAILCGTIYVPFCFGIKSLIMTIDDILDHDIDKLVARTKNRALPRGAISLERAWLLFGEKALYISMTVWPLYIIYPTCKRWTSLAPILLGIMFNFINIKTGRMTNISRRITYYLATA
ncbi:4-hydroxybenzoate polyprenyltransferase, mitochondrial [Mycena venus]|uniref:4-hydroxybenzoate polyprenyltransferase, mitochondrial n=1 Tax=Mycena venus TaxID=2733690 RepID=A0A8H6Z6K9_9AGAR|nr:4-hydroxybenzoate polyprenyltransferase, mitochondrial [Mycena venus]